jgi:hypothetical protein
MGNWTFRFPRIAGLNSFLTWASAVASWLRVARTGSESEPSSSEAGGNAFKAVSATNSLGGDNAVDAPTRSAAGRARPLLVFCVLSAPRPTGTDYLPLLLESLLREIDTAAVVGAVILDVAGPGAPGSGSSGNGRPLPKRLARMAARFPEFQFEPLLGRNIESCRPGEAACGESTKGSIPCCVRQQTRDVAAGLAQVCASVLNVSAGYCDQTPRVASLVGCRRHGVVFREQGKVGCRTDPFVVNIGQRFRWSECMKTDFLYRFLLSSRSLFENKKQ